MRFFLLTAAAVFWLEAAQICTWRVKNVEIGWEAFKTPLKIGVKGGFGTVKLSAKPDESIDGLLEGARVIVETESIDSDNRARDAKLVKSFFRIQGVQTVTAQIVRVLDDIVEVEITMNGQTRTVPMRLTRGEERVEAVGVLDLADFRMLPSLTALNEACKEPHQNKTWQDVKISFTLDLTQKCKEGIERRP